MSKIINELLQEFRTVFSGRTNTVDTIIPPLLYVLVNMLAGLVPATVSALVFAAFMTVLRLVRKQSWLYAFSGMVLTLFAAGLAWYTQNAASYFLPGLLSSGALLAGALFSILVRKPLAAWSSHLTRSWPRQWYWLPNICPAYTEVTWMWIAFIAMRLAAQYFLYQQGNVSLLGWANVILGWPVTILVLVVSYLYGIWRLKKLGGPSVEEFLSHQPAPWKGQKRGF
ncbi:MAG: DUF3159 domain-containing protein [Anaerolineaceae bacterium]|nr:DUF3159 domain-containing protein [Anaerolineaceae bacterium]